MLKRITRLVRRIRIKLLRARVEMLGQVQQELQTAGLDTHRISRIRTDVARLLAMLQAQQLRDQVQARLAGMFHVDHQRAA